MNIKTVLTLAIFLAVFSNLRSQSFSWADAGGGASSDIGNAVTVDGAGNRYIAGTFQSTATFGSYTLTSNGGNDLFLIKYDTAGNISWALSVGGSGDDRAYALKTDAAGNIYMSGIFTGTDTFGTGISKTALVSNGGNDAFVAKYNSSGSLLWAKSMGGVNTDGSPGLALDSLSNVYVCGYFNGTGGADSAFFGPYTLYSKGLADVFIAKLDKNGKWIWATSAGDKSAQSATDIAVDRWGNAYISGSFQGSPVFGSSTLSNKGLNDMFLAKCDSAGNFIWAQQAAGSLDDVGNGVAVDHNGNPYLLGSFQSILVVGSNKFKSAGGSDILHVKFDSAGNVLWANAYGSSNSEYGNKIVADTGGNTYICGSFGGGLKFGGKVTYSSVGGYDIYVASFDSTGRNRWVKTAGSVSDDDARRIAVDSAENVYITGFFKDGKKSSISFDKAYSFTSNGLEDVYVAEISLCKPLSPSLTMVGKTEFCLGDSVVFSTTPGKGYTYQWRLNGSAIKGATGFTYVAYATGAYSVTVYDPNGCKGSSPDSNITVGTHVTISTVRGNSYLCAKDSTFSYISIPGYGGYSTQWYRNGAAIKGATDTTVYIKTPGLYYAVVNNFGCLDTSNTDIYSALPAPLLSAIGKTTLCSSDSVKLISTSVPGVKYQWYKDNALLKGAVDTAITVKDSGLYTIKRTGSPSCSIISNPLKVNMDMPDTPVITLPLGPYLRVKDSAATYQWYRNGKLIPGAISRNFVPALKNDSYTVSVMDTNGCASYSKPFYFLFNGIAAQAGQLDFSIFPNPNDGVFTLDFRTALPLKADIRIMDALGRIVYSAKVNAVSETVDLSHLANGMYYLHLVSPGKYTSRIINISR